MTGRKKILFVEDDPDFRFLIEECLALTGRYVIETACNGKEGLKKYKTFKPDVIVADIAMPEMSGLEMAEEIRAKNENIPIILATGKTGQADRIEGLKRGVDNYIHKPYIPEVLDMYIQSLFRKETTQINQVYQIGEFLFDKKNYTLKWNGETYPLTVRETEVLWMLYEEKSNLVKRQNILEKFWVGDTYHDSRALDVCINKIRNKLRKDLSIQLITMRGEGYILKIDE